MRGAGKGKIERKTSAGLIVLIKRMCVTVELRDCCVIFIREVGLKWEAYPLQEQGCIYRCLILCSCVFSWFVYKSKWLNKCK